jgi:hypothetical protein
MTAEQIQDIRGFSKMVMEGIDMASCDFETKRRIIDLLDIQVFCTVDDSGEKLVGVKCVLGTGQHGLTTGSHVHIWGVLIYLLTPRHW